MPFNLPKRLLIDRDCCCCRRWWLTESILDPSDEEPVEDLYLYYTAVDMSGDLVDELDAASYGSQGIGQFDGAGLAAFLQGLAIEDAGAGMEQGDAQYAFWIVLNTPTAPSDWKWNGAPISFTEAGAATLLCYDTGVVPFVPDTTAWVQLVISTLMGTETVQGVPANYADGTYPDFWAVFAKQVGGMSATGTATVDGTTVRLQIVNTYLTFNTNSSYDGVDIQVDNFNLVACP